MFTSLYEVRIEAKNLETDNIVTGYLHFHELSAVTEFLDLANEFYDFETFEVYRVYKQDFKYGGFCSCRVENM